MRYKQILALIIVVIGIGALGTGFYYKKRITETQKGVETLLSPMSGNPFSHSITEDLSAKLKGYEIKIHLLLGLGALMTAFGVSYYFYLKQKKSSLW